jgi:hypothetical protein
MSGQIQRPNTCGNCVYVHEESNELFCRFNPPETHPLIVATTGDDGKITGAQVPLRLSVWPNVQAGQWCGQHKKQLIQHAREVPKQLQTFGGLQP